MQGTAISAQNTTNGQQQHQSDKNLDTNLTKSYNAAQAQ